MKKILTDFFDKKKNRLLAAFIVLLLFFVHFVHITSDVPQGKWVPPILKAVVVLGVFIWVCFRASEWLTPASFWPLDFRKTTRRPLGWVVGLGSSVILGYFAHWMLGTIFFVICILMYVYPDETQEIFTGKEHKEW